MRQEGDGVVEALREMLKVARVLDIPMQISHLKGLGRRNWRKAVPEMLRLIARAREEGLDVMCDVYPYPAGSTQLIHILPPEYQSGGVDASSSGPFAGERFEKAGLPAIRLYSEQKERRMLALMPAVWQSVFGNPPCPRSREQDTGDWPPPWPRR